MAATGRADREPNHKSVDFFEPFGRFAVSESFEGARNCHTLYSFTVAFVVVRSRLWQDLRPADQVRCSAPHAIRHGSNGPPITKHIAAGGRQRGERLKRFGLPREPRCLT
jgi:hypothetical protein